MATHAHRTQRSAFYLRQAVTHPVHILVALCFPFALIFAWSAPALAAVIFTDVTLLCVVARFPVFQRWVDERARAAEAAVAAKSRIQLLARITDAHRNELQRLEMIADAIRERLTPANSTQAAEDCLGTGRLLATYVGGAMAYRAGIACLMSTDRKTLDVEIESLARSASGGRSDAVRRIAGQRLRIARMRAARWDATYADLEVMQEQLALIGDLIRLLYEHAAAPAPSVALRDEVDRAFADVSEGQHTVRELVELLAIDDAPEPRVLEMGRRALEATAEQAARLGVPPVPDSRVRIMASEPEPLESATLVSDMACAMAR